MRLFIERGDYQQGSIEDEGDEEGPEAYTHAEVPVRVRSIHNLGDLEDIDVKAEGETERWDDSCIRHADVLTRDGQWIIWHNRAKVISVVFAREDAWGQVEDQAQEDDQDCADDWEGEEFEFLEIQDPAERNQGWACHNRDNLKGVGEESINFQYCFEEPLNKKANELYIDDRVICLSAYIFTQSN